MENNFYSNYYFQKEVNEKDDTVETEPKVSGPLALFFLREKSFYVKIKKL